MSELIRLVYASRSTFSPHAKSQRLDPGVARILAKSRRNNARAHIVGGLLFGDGCFLQCLEGDDQAVDTLYQKIAADPRHRDVKVLSRQLIEQRSFGNWSMKYVPGELALSGLLQSWGVARFDPYSLSYKQIEAAIHQMHEEADGAVTLPGEVDDAAEPAPAHKVSRAAPGLITEMRPTVSVKPVRAQTQAQTQGHRPGPSLRRPGVLHTGWMLAAIGALGAVLYWLLG